MNGPTDVEHLQNTTLEALEHRTGELTDQQFLFNCIQTLNTEDKAVALTRYSLCAWHHAQERRKLWRSQDMRRWRDPL